MEIILEALVSITNTSRLSKNLFYNILALISMSMLINKLKSLFKNFQNHRV